MLPYRSAPGIPCVRFAPFSPDGCLYRGLRVLSEPRITLIFADGL